MAANFVISFIRSASEWVMKVFSAILLVLGIGFCAVNFTVEASEGDQSAAGVSLPEGFRAASFSCW